MKKLLSISIAALFVLSLISASSMLYASQQAASQAKTEMTAQAKNETTAQTKTGWITDTMCKEKGLNAQHRECALKCVAQGHAKFAFYDNDSKMLYVIDNQEKAKEFAGSQVQLKGSFDNSKMMVKVESMEKLQK